jgi:hypothetical protein
MVDACRRGRRFDDETRHFCQALGARSTTVLEMILCGATFVPKAFPSFPEHSPALPHQLQRAPAWRSSCSVPIDCTTSRVYFFRGGVMALVGLVVTFAGFVLAAASVGITTSTTGRLGIVLVGIVLTLVGILGMINPAYQKDAIWKK